MTIELGKVAKDTVSGFAGVVTAHCVYLHGPDRFELTPNAPTADGITQDARWFEATRLSAVEANEPVKA